MNQVNQLTEWLNLHTNRMCTIQKEEDGDIDAVELKLNRVSLGKMERKDPDDYVENEALLLHGEGSIQSGGQQAPLPLDAYEIPLTDTLMLEEQQDVLKVTTERAIYTIRVQ